jgi:hypothetical protein
VFLHVDGIHHEPVRRFALAIDREIARIQIAGRVDGSRYARHDHRGGRQRRQWSHAGLNREQIRVAAAVQRQRLNLLVCYDLAEMRRHRVDLRLNGFRGVRNRDRFGWLTYLHYGVDAERGIGIDGEVRLLLRAESGRFNRQIVMAHGEGRERVEALCVGGHSEFGFEGSVDQREFGALNDAAARILN